MKDVYIDSCTKKYRNNPYVGQVKITGPGKNDGPEERELLKYSYEEAFRMAENLGSNIV